jgi:hypothetical protein
MGKVDHILIFLSLREVQDLQKAMTREADTPNPPVASRVPSGWTERLKMGFFLSFSSTM